MRTQRVVGIALALFVIVLGPSAGAEQLSPLETIKGPISQIIVMLNDSSYQTPEQKKQQRDKMWAAIHPMFDFGEISQRTLGRDWQRFSKEEQGRFTKLFAEFLGNTYISKMQGEFHNERIVFLSELVKGTVALARTKVLRESLEISIDYRMKQINGNWKIYDVLVENGISMVKNYRIQFRSILKKETPAQLIERLQQKLDALESNAP